MCQALSPIEGTRDVTGQVLRRQLTRAGVAALSIYIMNNTLLSCFSNVKHVASQFNCQSQLSRQQLVQKAALFPGCVCVIALAVRVNCRQEVGRSRLLMGGGGGRSVSPSACNGPEMWISGKFAQIPRHDHQPEDCAQRLGTNKYRHALVEG